VNNVLQPIAAAVVGLESCQAATGIGRVFHSLSDHWGARVRLVDAPIAAPRLPIAHNFPSGVRVPAGADIVLLPRLTGAAALRDTQGIPSLAIVHDIGVVDFPGDREGMDWLTYQSIRQSFYGLRYASRIATDSQFTRRRLIERLPEIAERVMVIPAGVGNYFLEYDRPRAKARQALEAFVKRSLGSPLIIYVGSEIPRKNIPLLLRVFRQVKEHHPAAQLLKVGGAGHPRWRAATLRLAGKLRLQIGEDLLILDQIDDALLADAYRAADVFVSASLYEGFGLTALEALALGTPVVVTNRGAFPEVVADAGRVVAPELAPMACAIDAALANPLPELWAIRSKKRAAGFSWSRAAEQYVEIMRGMCARPAASAVEVMV
jgi:glycosyltransferase involved in cell wall biosynthesis